MVSPPNLNSRAYWYFLQRGNFGGGNGQFDRPYGIAVDAVGTVYVSAMLNNRIQKFSSTGSYLGQWGNGQFTYPAELALDSAGDVYVADIDGQRVVKFDGNGTFLMQIGTYGNGNGQLSVHC